MNPFYIIFVNVYGFAVLIFYDDDGLILIF
jgi:hypothetical protein